MRALKLIEMNLVAGRNADEGTTSATGVPRYTGEQLAQKIGGVAGSAALGLLGAAGGAYVAGPFGATVGLMGGRMAGKFAGAATGSYLSKKSAQNNAHLAGTDDAVGEDKEVGPVY